jgi:type I restriction enzyme S subunit
MNPELLLTHFNRTSDAPDAIPRLRSFILDLAVRGKLVEQVPTDESVVELLVKNDQARRAIAEVDRRAAAGTQVPLAAESRWNIPPSWHWCTLADLVLFIDYRGKTPTKTEKGVRLITAKNVKKGFINSSPEEFLSEPHYHAWMTRGFPKEGDILFTTEAPMGNTAVVRLPERFGLAQRVICFHPYGTVDPDFLTFHLLSEPFQSILIKMATGLTAKGIKAAKLTRLPVAVPPLAEQRRIVTRVNELISTRVITIPRNPTFNAVLTDDPSYHEPQMNTQATVCVTWQDPFMPPEPVERTMDDFVKLVADIVPRFDRFCI